MQIQRQLKKQSHYLTAYSSHVLTIQHWLYTDPPIWQSQCLTYRWFTDCHLLPKTSYQPIGAIVNRESVYLLHLSANVICKTLMLCLSWFVIIFDMFCFIVQNYYRNILKLKKRNCYSRNTKNLPQTRSLFQSIAFLMVPLSNEQ